MKRNYIKPQMDVFRLAVTSMLAGSVKLEKGTAPEGGGNVAESKGQVFSDSFSGSSIWDE